MGSITGKAKGKQEVKAGASGFQSFYLKTLNYIIIINSNLFHLLALSAWNIFNLYCTNFVVGLAYLKALYLLEVFSLSIL